MSGRYDDIIGLPHPTSRRHPRMPIRERAAIFSPFAALSGHGAAIAETARLTDRKMELDEDTKTELDRRQAVLLAHIGEQPEVTVTWFQPDKKKDGGAYITTTGRLKKLDTVQRVLVLLDGTSIPLEDVVSLESGIFQTVPGERHLPNTHIVGRKWEHGLLSAVLPFAARSNQMQGTEGEAHEYPKNRRLQRHIWDTGSAHGDGAPADGAVFRDWQRRLCPPGEGCGGHSR